MAILVLNKIDKILNYLTISFIICGSTAIHILTALTINSYYGATWGYLSFLTPGFSEIYLLAIQINENMYNYMILLTLFISGAATLGTLWFIKNAVKSRVIE